MIEFATTDLADAGEANPGSLQFAAPIFRSFGQRTKFAGPAATIRVHEDNVLVRSTLETPGDGRVLVIDGGGSLRCAIVGDLLAGFGATNGWAGLVVNGCIRDSAEIDSIDIGIRCLGVMPNRSRKNGFGESDVVVEFAGVKFTPTNWVYVDADGILVSAEPVHG